MNKIAWIAAYLMLGLGYAVGDYVYKPKNSGSASDFESFLASTTMWPMLVAVDAGWNGAKRADQRRGLMRTSTEHPECPRL